MFGQLGGLELGIILVIVVLIVGVGKVADVGPALGKAISGFRRAVRDDDEEGQPATQPELSKEEPALKAELNEEEES
jgi:sec-independent protein translocase protein TatA